MIKSILNVFFLIFSINLFAQPHSEMPSPLEGRWDLTIDVNGKPKPAWLEMRHSGVQTNLVGRVMIIGGSSRPISKIVVDGSKFSFAVMPQWEKSDNDVEMTGNLVGDKIEGTYKSTSGKIFNWTGERMPSLLREKTPEWGKEFALFNGKDMMGWHTDGENQWVVENGVMKSPKSGANLISDQKFNDFKLHIEFRYPLGSNSGVYLRGRYEVQVTDGKGKEPWDTELSGVYGVVSPNKMVAKDAGEWQSFDIILVGRTVTVALNGITVISEQVIPGITGGAIDSKEGEPGPFMIQGDHGPIEYRNILVTPAK